MSINKIGNLVEFTSPNGDRYLGVLGHLYYYPANTDSTIEVSKWQVKLLADKGIDKVIISEMLKFTA